MCGRFTLGATFDEMERFFRPKRGEFSDAPRHNIAPGQYITALVGQLEQRQVAQLRWGLIPAWSRDKSSGYKMINARTETIDLKPAFKGAFRHRRCLIPADGFYEWKKAGAGKEPFYIFLPGRPVFAFAGIWERWGPPGREILSCSIITTGANQFMQDIHQRMPVILAGREECDAWLQESFSPALKRLLVPYGGSMLAGPASSLVNKPENQGPF